MRRSVRLAAVAAILSTTAAGAADRAPPDPAPQAALAGDDVRDFRLLDEVRLRALGYDLELGEHAGGAGVELLSAPLAVDSGNKALDFVLGPRLHAGAAGAFGEIGYAYAGFTWTAPLGEHLFLEAALGGAVNTGGADGALGCAATFREAAALGWSFGDHWRLLAGIEHLSHANLCGDDNPGLTAVSTALGYRF